MRSSLKLLALGAIFAIGAANSPGALAANAALELDHTLTFTAA